MKRYYPIYISAVLAAAMMPHQASAQNLDPTVEVNRAYEGKLVEVDKPSVEMAVPDSVLRFDLDFDYAVFENPYKGAYEFKPYAMTMQPVKAPVAQNDFYLKVGAGLRPVSLSVMPVFDMVWAPVHNNSLKINVYSNHESYVGSYMNFPVYDWPSDGSVVNLIPSGETGYGSYDLCTRAGAEGRYDWNGGVVRIGVDYQNISEKFRDDTDVYNTVGMSALVASKDFGQFLNYEAGVSYSFGNDIMRFQPAKLEMARMNEHDIRVFGKLKASLAENHKMVFDLGVDNVSCSGSYNAMASRLVFAPSYQFILGRLDVSAGFRIEAVVTGENPEAYSSGQQYVYPDVKVAYHMIPGAMKAYALVTGGTKMNTFGSLKNVNHHANLRFARSGDLMNGAVLMDNTVERVSAALGLKGRAGKVFAYDVRGGFSSYANALVDGVEVYAWPIDDKLRYHPGIGYATYDKAFVIADLHYENEGLKADAGVSYNHCWFKGTKDTYNLFLPAAFEGNANIMYGWNKRVYLGLDCLWAAARPDGVVVAPDMTERKVALPGYADLGVDFEYLASRKFSFWMRGGNLLNMAVQRNLLYAETGPYFALGICLNL